MGAGALVVLSVIMVVLVMDALSCSMGSEAG